MFSVGGVVAQSLVQVRRARCDFRTMAHSLPKTHNPHKPHTRARRPDTPTIGLGLKSWAFRKPHTVYKSSLQRGVHPISLAIITNVPRPPITRPTTHPPDQSRHLRSRPLTPRPLPTRDWGKLRLSGFKQAACFFSSGCSPVATLCWRHFSSSRRCLSSST